MSKTIKMFKVSCQALNDSGQWNERITLFESYLEAKKYVNEKYKKSRVLDVCLLTEKDVVLLDEIVEVTFS